MCADCDMEGELKRLPLLLQERLADFIGMCFQVIACECDIKVRVAWHDESTTTYSCHTADEVVWWLDQILVMTTPDTKNLCS